MLMNGQVNVLTDYIFLPQIHHCTMVANIRPVPGSLKPYSATFPKFHGLSISQIGIYMVVLILDVIS